MGPPGAQPWALPTCPRASALVVWVVHQPLTQSWSSTKTRPRRQDVSAGHPPGRLLCRAGQRGWRRGTRGRSVKPLWAPTRFKWRVGPSQTRCVPPRVHHLILYARSAVPPVSRASAWSPGESSSSACGVAPGFAFHIFILQHFVLCKWRVSPECLFAPCFFTRTTLDSQNMHFFCSDDRK